MWTWKHHAYSTRRHRLKCSWDLSYKSLINVDDPAVDTGQSGQLAAPSFFQIPASNNCFPEHILMGCLSSIPKWDLWLKTQVLLLLTSGVWFCSVFFLRNLSSYLPATFLKENNSKSQDFRENRCVGSPHPWLSFTELQNPLKPAVCSHSWWSLPFVPTNSF